MFDSIKLFIKVVVNQYKLIRARKSKTGLSNSMVAELMRNTHSIEKGLTISEPRLGFGHKKQADMMEQIQALMGSDDIFHKEACEMAVGALAEYLAFHSSKGYTDQQCEEIQAFIDRISLDGAGYGGTIDINKDEFVSDKAAIEGFFRSRHSIRDFDDSPVDDEELKKALALAQTAPSACNRQAVRVYILSNHKSRALAADLSGIGGFADVVDRFILITGKTSAYRLDEINQYIVSASIYAAYLTLTLHLYGIGACVVQRPVIWTKKWEAMRLSLNIHEDEQMVCMLAIGNLKDQYKVPLSHRVSTESMVRFID